MKKNNKRAPATPAWTPFRKAIPTGPRADLLEGVMVQNSRYVVIVTLCPNTWVHLSIRRQDRKEIHDWRDLQRIKREILGPDWTAVEIYPPDAREMDTVNQYHLWATPHDIGLGFYGPRQVGISKILEANQRAFEEGQGELLSDEEIIDWSRTHVPAQAPPPGLLRIGEPVVTPWDRR